MKEALIKAGIQHVISNNQLKAPGSDLEALPKQKKRYFWQKKEDPHYLLTPHEKKILHKVKSRARTLDSGLSCCCCQVGIDPIIGMLFGFYFYMKKGLGFRFGGFIWVVDNHFCYYSYKFFGGN